MHNPLVSILIPNYNKALYLRETLDSVLAQTYTIWECIIVDDHSTDNSWEILEEYAKSDPRIKIYRRPENRKPGGNAARNYAFELSKGDYVNWLDSDDILINDKIQKQLQVITQSNYDFVLTELQNFEDVLIKSKFRFEENKKRRPLQYLKGSFWFQTSIPLFKRTFLASLDRLFNEDLRRNQEGEFFTRILLLKPEIFFIKKIKVIRRQDKDSISSKYLNLTLAEKIRMDYPASKSIFSSFKKYSFLGKEEREFFIKFFILTIQYSDFELEELFKPFFNSVIYGTPRQKILALKSYLHRVINDK